jgi:hypothetical protein
MAISNRSTELLYTQRVVYLYRILRVNLKAALSSIAVKI